MKLARLLTDQEPRWILKDKLLPPSFELGLLLELPARKIPTVLKSMATKSHAEGLFLAPIESSQEVWAAGVTYLRSREARMQESDTADIYDRVYFADRPELFFKSLGWRVINHKGAIRIRKDSTWNVPEPELTLIINRYSEIIGYTAGNDMSSRDIEGQNPLYLPQAKVYNGSCALGPVIVMIPSDFGAIPDLPIQLHISRQGTQVFSGNTRTSRMKRQLKELVDFLFYDLTFPQGVFLMTGTGIVPDASFSLQIGDIVTVTVGEVILENIVA